MKRDARRAVMAAAATLMGLAPGLALGAQLPYLSKDYCAQATNARERAATIPRHLLGAISLAESGRWDDARQANIAWPWTVTARGEGQYFPSKAAAVRHVRQLRGEGVRNIDVGCMQINLFYHADAFASLSQALDPKANVAYAAKFLKDQFAATGSWVQAAANYHSMTPEKGRAYRQKVVRLWREERNRTESAGRAEPNPRKVTRRRFAAIDAARTERLNARLRDRRADQRKGETNAADIRRGQLRDWREGRRATGLSAAAQRARVFAERRRRLLGEAAKPEKRRRRPLRWIGS